MLNMITPSPSPSPTANAQDVTATHTPGPWAWDAGIIPPDGPGRYADIYVSGEHLEPIIIAEFNDNIPEGRANACLIAAAPDTLHELREARITLNILRAQIMAEIAGGREIWKYVPETLQTQLNSIDAALARATAA